MANVKKVGKTNGNLVKELDAAIALLTRARTLAISSMASVASSKNSVKQPSAPKTKRVMSATARESIAAAQRKRWAKVRRQKKQAARSAAA